MTSGPAPDYPTIYRAQFTYVWNTLRRLGVPTRDLEDLTHDLFLVAYRRLPDYDPARPIRPWLFGIAVRLVADFRKAARNVHETVGITAGLVEPAESSPAADERIAASQARGLLMRALGALDLDRRAVFVMHEIDELAVPDIAAALEIPLNTAYSRLRLARADVAAAARRIRLLEEPHG